MSKSLNDLKEAFAGESQANRKYLAYAAAAEKEGLVGVSKLFKAAAAAETVHEGPIGRTGKGTRSGIVFTNRADVSQSRCPAGRRDCRVGPQPRGRAPQGV